MGWGFVMYIGRYSGYGFECMAHLCSPLVQDGIAVFGMGLYAYHVLVPYVRGRVFRNLGAYDCATFVEGVVQRSGIGLTVCGDFGKVFHPY